MRHKSFDAYAECLHRSLNHTFKVIRRWFLKNIISLQKNKSMKKLLSISAILFLVACNYSTSTDKLLAEVWHRDQHVRHQMQELTKAVSIDGKMELVDSLIMICESVDRIDNENIAIIDSLLQQGLPRGLSKESYKTIWIVIDHASLEKQEQYLPLIEQMTIEGFIESDNYAILFDRIAMKRNRPQRYGSQSVQFGSPGNMNLYIWPVENFEIVLAFFVDMRYNCLWMIGKFG